MLLPTISYICLNTVNPPTPESMLFVDKERLEGLKHNIGFRERGGGTQGDGIGMFTVHKRPFYRSVSTRLSLIVAMITVHFNYPKRRFDILKLLPM